MCRYYKYILAFIVVLGFLLKLKVCNELLVADPNVLNPSHLTDMATYKTLGMQISQGNFWRLFYFQPFYYAVFLAGIFKLLGTNLYYVLISQSLLGALTILFGALSAQILWNRKTAIIVSIFLLFSQTLNFYAPFLLIVTLQSFWISLLLYMTLLAFAREKNHYWIYIGLITGCSILTRGNMWLFVPVLLALVFYFGARKKRLEKNLAKRYFVPIIYFLFFMILPQFPFIYINSKILHKFSGASTVASAALTYGNTPESAPAANFPEFGAGVIAMNPTQKYWLKNADKVSVVKRIADFIRQKPLSYFELTFRKLLLFWDYREIPNNVNINAEYLLSPTLKYVCIITTAILMVLAIPGILIFLPLFTKERRRFLIPLLFILTYWGSISFVKILARYRAPIIPVLAIYAGGFIFFAFSRTKSAKKIFAIIILVLFSVFIVYFSYDFYRYNFESKVIRFIDPDGIVVNMGEKTMYMDNGPIVFGSWITRQFKVNDIILKTFAVNSKKLSSKGNFHIPLIAVTPVNAVISINDKNFDIESKTTGRIIKDFSVPIKYIQDKKGRKKAVIKIKVRKLAGQLFYILDYQRNFGRTKIDNRQINAELVCRLYLLNY